MESNITTQIHTQINGKRVLIEVIGKKKIYRYFNCPKCGIEKKPKSPYCASCQLINQKNKVGFNDSDNSDKISKKGSTLLKPNGVTVDDIILTKLDLVNWVNKINRRNGIASMEDVFVHMITFYNYFGREGVFDILPTNEQLKLMWEFLQKKAKEFSQSELTTTKSRRVARDTDYLNYQRDYQRVYRKFISGQIDKDEFDRIKPIKLRK